MRSGFPPLQEIVLMTMPRLDHWRSLFGSAVPTPRAGYCRDAKRRRIALAIVPLLLLVSACSQNEGKPKEAKQAAVQTIEVSPITPVATGKHHPGRFVWHDLVTDDIETAKQFYGGLFGWTFETRGRYTSISNQGKVIAGMIKVEFEPGISPFWVPYLSVDDLDNAVDTATGAGGELLRGPGKMINRGRFALIGDPEGARLVLLHAETGDPAPVEPELNGWLWDELWTGDVPKSLAFYQRLGPYQTLPAPDNKTTDYQVLTIDDRWAAGLTTLPFDDMHAQWVPALRVRDLGYTMAQVDKLGGRVLIKPDHALTDGNIALIQDPSGAILMVDPWTPKPAADGASDNNHGGDK